MRILVVGGGTGGTIVANNLARRLAGEIRSGRAAAANHPRPRKGAIPHSGRKTSAVEQQGPGDSGRGTYSVGIRGSRLETARRAENEPRRCQAERLVGADRGPQGEKAVAAVLSQRIGDWLSPYRQASATRLHLLSQQAA